ncbi:MAG: hypothetical protein GY859_40705, partial [Desulfobacterales bacterium]|nr:hypothetical protein [Desulfobacterales bacterium]
LPGLIDDHAFNQLAQIPQEAFEKRLDACHAYLTTHPKGRHKKQVHELIAKMEEPYYLSLEESLVELETAGDWGACIESCQRFLARYDTGKRADEIVSRLEIYRKKLADADVFTQLTLRAKHAGGGDASAARDIYLRYLAENPDSTVKDKVEEALKKLNETERKRLLTKGGGRYKEAAEGVVLDTTTRLMWCVVEPAALRNECVD